MVEEGWAELGKARCEKCFIGVVPTVFMREGTGGPGGHEEGEVERVALE